MSRAGRKPPKCCVTGGVDTHSQTHHAAVQLMNGAQVADAEFPATSQGYAELLDWMRSFGRLHAVGVEGHLVIRCRAGPVPAGTGCHRDRGQPRHRAQRRAKGKSYLLDARRGRRGTGRAGYHGA